jgi:hypothetical protein
MWALWIVGGLVAWVVVAVLAGMVIGRGIRIADRQAAAGRELVAAPGGARQRAVARTRRRALPLPPAGIALAVVAVVLETTGYVLSLTQAEGTARRLLSMDTPHSLPRMFVAALFAAAAVTAILGAGSLPGRRAWWTAVGVVAGLIAAVKAGGTIHAAAITALSQTLGSAAAQAVSVLLAVGVIAALWWLSRSDRRDRRRVLGTLALYAVAAVGLSGITDFVAGDSGSFVLTVTSTFIEESSEALSGVGFLVAVLAGVAPRLVLPGTWPLRREADNFTLDSAEAVPGRLASDGRR